MDELQQIIAQCAREIAASQESGATIEVQGDTRLFGDGGLLDSLALVSLIVAVEQAIADRYGKVVSLADEKALSQRHSPYRTVETLAVYAAAELASHDGA